VPLGKDAKGELEQKLKDPLSFFAALLLLASPPVPRTSLIVNRPDGV